MTILSAQSIRQRCLDGDMITPFVSRTNHLESGLTYGLGPASYDIRIENTPHDILLMYPGFQLATVIEYFRMPADIQGVVHDKSTWARRGLAVQNTVIDPGFQGSLTIELTNHSNELLKIFDGTPIAQIVFHKLDEDTDQPYNGKYQNQQRGPQKAR